jgi:hypothetical protein
MRSGGRGGIGEVVLGIRMERGNKGWEAYHAAPTTESPIHRPIPKLAQA